MATKRRPIYIPQNSGFMSGGHYDQRGSGAWAGIKFRGRTYYARSHGDILNFLVRRFSEKVIDQGKFKLGYFHTKRSRNDRYRGKGGWETKE